MQKCFNFFLKNQGTSGKNMQQILSLVLVAILGNDEDGGEGRGGRDFRAGFISAEKTSYRWLWGGEGGGSVMTSYHWAWWRHCIPHVCVMTLHCAYLFIKCYDYHNIRTLSIFNAIYKHFNLLTDYNGMSRHISYFSRFPAVSTIQNISTIQYCSSNLYFLFF